MAFSVVLFDDYQERNQLLPLVATRPVGNLRIGAFTLNEKWELLTGQDVSYWTVDYLQSKYSLCPLNPIVIVVNANVLPSEELVQAILNSEINCNLIDEQGKWIAVKVMKEDLPFLKNKGRIKWMEAYLVGTITRIAFPEDIFTHNADQIKFDLSLTSLSVIDQEVYASSNQFFGSAIYVADSAKLDGVVLDARMGPVWIDDDAIIESGVVVKGPAYVGKKSRLKLGTMIYPNVTIGPGCTVSGEINNTVIWGHSAKGHDGYLGCAVLGEGCNLGAGTANSNLKNDWSSVKLYDYASGTLRDTGLVKCGVIIGDQAMLGILSKINTGTIIGVGAQVAMSTFIPKFVPNFSWYTEDKQESYIFGRFVEMMKRKAAIKNEIFDDLDYQIFQSLYNKN